MNIERLPSSYISVNLEEQGNNIFLHNYIKSDELEYPIESSAIGEICNKIGIPKSTNKIVKKTNPELWLRNIIELYKYYYGEDIVFLQKGGVAVDFTTKKQFPLLHENFLKIVHETFSEYPELLELAESPIPNETTMQVLISRKSLLEYEENFYKVGYILTNDELDTVSCRIFVEISDIVYYLPSNYCNLSSARYNRSSDDSQESLRLLLLKLLGDMMEEGYYSRLLEDVATNIKRCKETPITYEEYKKSLRLLSRVSVNSELDEEEYQEIYEEFTTDYEDFIKQYPNLEEKQGSYIWRCTAIGENNMYSMICSINRWTESHVFYPLDLTDIRRTLGEFLMSDKISELLARRRFKS